MSRSSRILIFVAALALLCAVVVALGIYSGRRGTLRTYVSELQARGEKLTYADLMRGRVANTNRPDTQAAVINAAVVLKIRPLNPGLLDLRKYVQPGQATVTWQQRSPMWLGSPGQESELRWQLMDAELQAAQDSLQTVREALKTPSPDAGPFTNMFTTRRVDFVAIRTVAQWLMGAAESDLHYGRLEAALQDIEALAGLAQMERDEPILVAQMIRVSVANLGLTLTWEALQAPGWTEPQLQRMQKAWEPVNELDSVETGLAGERVCSHELFATIRRSDGASTSRLLRSSGSMGGVTSKLSFDQVMMDYVYLPVYKLTSIELDELFYLRNMQESIASVRLVKERHPWAEARQRSNQVNSNVVAVARSLQKIRHLLSLMAIPNYGRALETGVHGETERQMMLAAIAMKRYQMRHGEPPPNLEALVPEFLPAVPFDYMGARPLSYRRKPDGSYVLYSVGDDGADDGGDPSPAPGARVGLWTGHDAVWPAPARADDHNSEEAGGVRR